MSCIDTTLHGAIALIRLNQPPVNSLGHELRTALVEALDRANADPAVAGLVITGSDRAFSGGADIKEFGTPKASLEPDLRTVIGILECSRKPTVAAIAGVCMGGGLELAMGAHFRVARADASIALPEVKLGLLPGAGGTQRLPRLIGIEAALSMMVSGQPIPAAKFKAGTLIDELIDGDLIQGAIRFAEKVIADGRPRIPVRDRRIDYPNHEAFLQFARNTIKGVAGPFPAPGKIVDALSAAITKPFDEGIEVENQLFTQLMLTPESRALRHLFQAERAASKIPDVPEGTPTRTIAKVGVIGAGTMGGGIAMNFLNAGLPVMLLEARQEALDRGIATIGKNYAGSVAKGKMTAAEVEQRMALLTPTLTYDALQDCDLIIEAVFEEISVKEGVFKTLDRVAKPGAILATNTSTLDVNRIAAFTGRPADVLGLHFFSPANVMKLLEVVRGRETSKDVLATVMALAKKIRKTAVVAGVCDGFIGNRMLMPYWGAAEYLIEHGATPWQVDRALEKFGMVMGPFRVSDLAGNDIGWAIRKRRYAEQPTLAARPNVADALCEQGRFGQKTGKGWYRYEAGQRNAIPDPEVEALLAAHRTALGITPRSFSDQQIVTRCVHALINEGARLLGEGIAARASDIDMVYLTGYGFPMHRGGPMRYADELGLYHVARTLEALRQEDDNPFWTPAPLISERLAAGQSLT
jgi:3-hydroxyacyl-CoA dehydrogenase